MPKVFRHAQLVCRSQPVLSLAPVALEFPYDVNGESSESIGEPQRKRMMS